jgi:tetratricopeptide (TPR) repeat protein
MMLENHFAEPICISQSKRTQTSEVSTIIFNAKTLMSYGEHQLALNMLRVACSKHSEDLDLLKTIASFLENMHNLAEALKIRQQILRLDYNFENLRLKARCEFDLGQDSNSLQSYFEALSMLHDQSTDAAFEIYKNIGNIYVRSSDYESAEENYNKAHALVPISDVLMVNYGTLEVQRGEMMKALDRFRQAVAINPLNDKAWTGLAMIHNEFGDHELALGNLQKALDSGVCNRTALMLYAKWMIRERQALKAIPAIESYLETVQQDEEMSFVLVHLFCECKEFGLAFIELEKILAWNPSHPQARQLQIQIQKESDQVNS